MKILRVARSHGLKNGNKPTNKNIYRQNWEKNHISN